jgi:hypothetical protein
MMGVLGELTRPRTVGGVTTCISRDVCDVGLLIVMSGVLSSTLDDKWVARQYC